MGKMNKKAQYYIFAAVVLLGYAFLIIRPAVQAGAETSAFKSLYENFISESPVIINNALYSSSNLSEDYKAFADEFISFAKTRSPNFRLVYLLAENDNLVVGNRLDIGINLTASSIPYTLASNSELTIPKPASASVIIGKRAYEFSFDERDIQAKFLFRNADRKEVRVYVQD
ncbi:MAG: hypothetical protein V1702_06750 [Candidatus Woesearchaeota archaeon]